MSIQQMLLGAGANIDRTYLDDIFSTYVYTGTGSSKSINNGKDLSTAGEEGLLWIKSRGVARNHLLVDTLRGASKNLKSNTDAQAGTETNAVSAFANNGFTLGTDALVNTNNELYSSWTWKSKPGFFDIVTYSGDNSNPRNIAHNLGSIPGCVMVKRTDSDYQWVVYHRGHHGDVWNNIQYPERYVSRLDTAATRADEDWFGDTKPTASVFTVSGGATNATGATYVAYIFAGGESTASTAKSMHWAESADRLSCGSSSSKTADFNFGTGDLTVECWFRAMGSQTDKPQLISVGEDEEADSFQLRWDHEDYRNKMTFLLDNFNGSSPALISKTKNFNTDGQWHHVAVTRNSNKWTLWIDGLYEDSRTWTGNTSGGNDQWCVIGNSTNVNSNVSYFKGRISNVRIVKGTAVYTNAFKPSTTPLTNITNTVLLCCNDSSRTGATVTPITLQESSLTNPTSSSPFDDPAGFVFGANSDQPVMKCGYFTGNGSSDGVEVNLGWEPQWILIKCVSNANSWVMYDTIRGISTGGTDGRLFAQDTDAEYDGTNFLRITPTGWKAVNNAGDFNGSGEDYIYIAIRRPDGYVGKPAATGTDVFALDTGSDSSTGYPTFDSNFPVDFGIYREFATADEWITSARLMETTRIRTDENYTQSTSWAYGQFDHNTGWSKGQGSTKISFMWGRHKGFDVVTYTGNGTGGRTIPHSLSQVPGMMWVKRRDSAKNWAIYHEGLNGGTNPEQYSLILNNSGSEDDEITIWQDTAPTTTHFTLGTGDRVNEDTGEYIAMLFSTVPKISKCGYYTGNASGNLSLADQLDFSPRFFMCKSTTASTGWLVVDNTTDTNMGKRMFFDVNTAQTSYDAVWAMSRTLESNKAGLSVDGEKYIFYAHA